MVCAAVSPYRATRDDVRTVVGKTHFKEVFVDAPVEVCEARDTKGMHARARQGEIKDFTRVDDPYEEAVAPEITLTTTGCQQEDNACKIIGYLAEKGLLDE